MIDGKLMLPILRLCSRPLPQTMTKSVLQGILGKQKSCYIGEFLRDPCGFINRVSSGFLHAFRATAVLLLRGSGASRSSLREPTRQRPYD